jgi:multicomponent Na+:H+ antiporter subunit F
MIYIIILIILTFFTLYRAIRGPSIADRMVAIDILGILVVGITAIYALITKRNFLMDIALAWVFLSFIGTIALAKVLEGKRYEE